MKPPEEYPAELSLNVPSTESWGEKKKKFNVLFHYVWGWLVYGATNEIQKCIKKKKNPARQSLIYAKDRYKGGLTQEKPLHVIYLNNILKEKKHNHLSKSRKAMDKIQHPLTVKSKPWQLGIEGILLNLIESIFQKCIAKDQFQ